MTKTKRIEALDALRGLTVAAMILFNNPGSWSAQYAPLKHAQWNGLTPTDLAFPFFVFIMGVSAFLSLRKYGQTGRLRATGHILRRSVLMYLVGMALVCFGPLCRGTFSFEGMRILGVLQRLALTYLFGALLLVYIPRRAHLWVSAAILTAYALLMGLCGGYAHDASNLVARIDVAVLGASHLIKETGDAGVFAFEPEGLLSTLPSVAHFLLGAYAGSILAGGEDTVTKVKRIALFGALLLICGFLLQYAVPVNKKLWTSTFVLVTSGGASLLLALMMELIDLRGKRFATGFLKTFGTNALLSYALSSVVAVVMSVTPAKHFVYSKLIYPAFSWAGPELPSLVHALFFVALIWLLVLPLYKRKIFIKL